MRVFALSEVIWEFLRHFQWLPLVLPSFGDTEGEKGSHELLSYDFLFSCFFFFFFFFALHAFRVFSSYYQTK